MSKVRNVGESRPLGRIRFSFESVVRVYEGPADWYFAHLPTELAKELDELFSDQKRGFGSLPVEVTIGDITWQTSIFTDKKNKSFMLPLKLQARKQAGLKTGDKFKVTIVINV